MAKSTLAVSDTGVPMPMPGKLTPVVISHGSRSAASMRTLPLAAGCAVGDAQIALEARLHVVAR